MPDFKATFQEEVRRLARKELKTATDTINTQQKTIRELTKRIEALEKKQAVAAPVAPKDDKDVKAVVPAKSSKARFSPKTILKFRKKHGISQKGFAALLGVATFTVSHWELGKNRPRTAQIEAISALVKLGKRKLIALLQEKAPAEFAALTKTAEKKAAKMPAKADKPAKKTRKPRTPKTAKAAAVPAPAATPGV